MSGEMLDDVGTQFTCFTGTKAQILAQKRYAASIHLTSNRILRLAGLAGWGGVTLYKSTNTDAEALCC